MWIGSSIPRITSTCSPSPASEWWWGGWVGGLGRESAVGGGGAGGAPALRSTMPPCMHRPPPPPPPPPLSDNLGMNLDPQFVRDLTVLIAASAAGGLCMEALRQPTINGYFIAGSLVGPGGFKLIKEIVQVGWVGGWVGMREVGAGCDARAPCAPAHALKTPTRAPHAPTHARTPRRSSLWLSWGCSCCCSRWAWNSRCPSCGRCASECGAVRGVGGGPTPLCSHCAASTHPPTSHPCPSTHPHCTHTWPPSPPSPTLLVWPSWEGCWRWLCLQFWQGWGPVSSAPAPTRCAEGGAPMRAPPCVRPHACAPMRAVVGWRDRRAALWVPWWR